jgi:hypothetical protein
MPKATPPARLIIGLNARYYEDLLFEALRRSQP